MLPPWSTLHHSHVALTHLLKHAYLCLQASCFGASAALDVAKTPPFLTSTDNHDPVMLKCFNVTPSEAECSPTVILTTGPSPDRDDYAVIQEHMEITFAQINATAIRVPTCTTRLSGNCL